MCSKNRAFLGNVFSCVPRISVESLAGVSMDVSHADCPMLLSSECGISRSCCPMFIVKARERNAYELKFVYVVTVESFRIF